jgi:hypothetical protein
VLPPSRDSTSASWSLLPTRATHVADERHVTASTCADPSSVPRENLRPPSFVTSDHDEVLLFPSVSVTNSIQRLPLASEAATTVVPAGTGTVRHVKPPSALVSNCETDGGWGSGEPTKRHWLLAHDRYENCQSPLGSVAVRHRLLALSRTNTPAWGFVACDRDCATTTQRPAKEHWQN